MAWIYSDDVYQLSHDGARMDLIDNGILVVTVSISAATSSTTIGSASNSKITANHVVVNSVIANPAYQTSAWTVTTSAGSVSVVGTASAATSVTLYLGLS